MNAEFSKRTSGKLLPIYRTEMVGNKIRAESRWRNWLYC
jgi:hypothetical protein